MSSKHTPTYEKKMQALKEEEARLRDEMEIISDDVQSKAIKALKVVGGILLIAGIGYGIYKYMSDDKAPELSESDTATPQEKTSKSTGQLIVDGLTSKLAGALITAVITLITGYLGNKSQAQTTESSQTTD